MRNRLRIRITLTSKKMLYESKGAQVGAMRGAGGRGGRVALACLTLRGYAGVYAGVCMQDFVRHLSRRQGCGGFNRSAHSAVPTWIIECLVDWRIEGTQGFIAQDLTRR